MLRYSGGLNFGLDPGGPGNPRHVDPNVPSISGMLDVCDMVRNAARTKHLSGHELGETHQLNCYPSDFIRSMSFETDITLGEGIREPAYCSCLILIDAFKSSSSHLNNTYELNVCAQRAARFAPGTLLHGRAREQHSDSGHHAKVTLTESQKDAAQPVQAGPAQQQQHQQLLSQSVDDMSMLGSGPVGAARNPGRAYYRAQQAFGAYQQFNNQYPGAAAFGRNALLRQLASWGKYA